MATESAELVEWWTAKWRVAVVVSILNGETSAAENAHQHGWTVDVTRIPCGQGGLAQLTAVMDCRNR